MSATTPKTKKKRNWPLLITIFLLALVFFGLFFAWIAVQLDEDNDSLDSRGREAGEEQTALLVSLKPEITVTRDDEVTTVDKEFEVEVGDRINVSEAGRGYIIFEDNSSLTLDAGSEIRLEEMETSDDSVTTKIKQLAGKTWSRVERLAGKDAEYEVETPNTVAAVRGTQFSCRVDNNDSTECWAIEHSIDLTLLNLGDDNKFELPEGDSFTNKLTDADADKDLEEIKKLIVKKVQADEWHRFNECITKEAREVLDEDGHDLGILKDNYEVLLACETGEVEGEDDEEEEAVVPPTAPTPPPAKNPPPPPAQPKPEVQSANIAFIRTGANCSWTATNADSYLVSFGSSADQTNHLNWTETTQTNFIFSKLVSGNFYVCNVKGVNEVGESAVKSSNKIYYDNNSSAVFRSTDPANGTYFNGYVSGTLDFNNLPDSSHLQVEYCIRREKDSYYAVYGGGWTNSVKCYTTPVTTSTKGVHGFNSGNNFTAAYSLEVTFRLKNKYSGKLLDTEIVNTMDPIIIF